MELGSDGFARISYHDGVSGGLKFARCTNADCSTSNITTVDTAGNGGLYTSISLGSDGFARISYYDQTNDDLKYARCIDADCTTSVLTAVDTAGAVGQYTSIALGSDGFARISYYDATNQDLKFARCTNADCTTSNVIAVDTPDAVGQYTSIALGSDGFARISYHDFTNADLKSARCTNTDCASSSNITTVDTAAADSTDVGAPLAAQDTPATQPGSGVPIRLRLLLHVGGSHLAQSSGNLKLQFAGRGGGTCSAPTGSPSSYTDVTDSTTVRYFDNDPGSDDGDPLTPNLNDPLHLLDTTRPQTYEEANNFTNSVSAVNVGQDGLWDFSLAVTGAPSGTVFCLRVVNDDNSLLNAYDVFPQINAFAIPVGDVMRHGNYFSGGVEQDFSWAD
jgi:uncharacterized protein YjbI with pentapeptide repeats